MAGNLSFSIPRLMQAQPAPAATDSTATSAPAALLRAQESHRQRAMEMSSLPSPVGSPQSRAASPPAASPAASPATSAAASTAGTSVGSPPATPPRSRANIGMFVAQPETLGLEPAAIALLTGRLVRSDLTALTSQLNEKLGLQWAYTGSVALQLHSMQRTGLPGRYPVDVDIEVDCNRYDQLHAGVHSNPPGSAMTVARNLAGEPLEHYYFNNELKVDLLKASRIEVAHPARRTRIAGIPVLTLEVLRARKNNDLFSHVPAIVTKARLDLAHIALLQAGEVALPAAPQPPSPADFGVVQRTLAF